ncbi:glycosyltransferase family protein, partial [Poseidonibacter sp.]|uniref:glycosyltransferase family protein n=1 Tax=Poseidonibacter sp. TaxID=2321188 RepID=UPI003C744B61
YKELAAYIKGELPYGEKIAEVYNSATFSLCPHPLSILQQRVFESAGCGAIPIVYDCRDLTDEIDYEESVCYFKSISELKKLLTGRTTIKKNFDKLLSDNSYENFITKIINIVEKDVVKNEI